MNNNYVSEGKSTIETTNKYSLKIDHTLSNTNRVAYVFNRTRNGIKAGPDGAVGLPAPFSEFSENTFDGDLHRASWDWVGASDGEPPDGWCEYVQQECVFAQRRSELERQGLHQERGRLQPEHGRHYLQRQQFSTWGATSYNGTKQPRFTVKDDVTFIKGSHTVKTGFTYDRQQANGFGQQDYGGRAGFDFKRPACLASPTSPRRAAARSRRFSSGGRTRGEPKRSVTCSRSIRTTGSTRRTIGA